MDNLKELRYEYNKKYYDLHKEELKLKRKIYAEKNKLKIAEKLKEWKENNKDRVKLTKKIWDLENKEHKANYIKEWKKNNPEKNISYAKFFRENQPDYHANRHLKTTYGITINQYNEMLEKQNGICAVCGKLPNKTSRGKLFVDHCHSKGKIRGLLCQQCNTALGMVNDNIDILYKLIKYLECNDA